MNRIFSYLHVSDLILFPLEFLHLVLLQLSPRLHEHVIVTLVTDNKQTIIIKIGYNKTNYNLETYTFRFKNEQ